MAALNSGGNRSYRDIINASDLDANDKYYWGYMYGLAESYIIPYLERKGIPIAGSRVIEIGCAEGGNLCAMQERGASVLVGTDIATVRLETARDIARRLHIDVDYSPHDVITDEPRIEWVGHFDLALLRDVIEHLDDAAAALGNIRRILRRDGILYVTFPPYYSPFGGHQQTLVNWSSKIPFMHLTPRPIFERMIASGREADKVEVRRLRQIRMTTTKLRKAAELAGYSVLDERLFLLRPVFKMKFGINPVSANFLRPFPVVRDMMALEAGYLLKVK